jgi:hypothetical protein
MPTIEMELVLIEIHVMSQLETTRDTLGEGFEECHQLSFGRTFRSQTQTADVEDSKPPEEKRPLQCV